MRIPESSEPKLVKSSRFFVLHSLDVASHFTFAESLTLFEILLLLFAHEPVYHHQSKNDCDDRQTKKKSFQISFIVA